MAVPGDDEGQPIGYQLLARGTAVVCADGTRLGRVQRVLDNAREHIFDGVVVVVRTEDRQVFVDAPEVDRITDRRVALTIDAVAAAQLPEDRGWRGAMAQRAQRTVTRWKRHLPGG